MGISTLVSSLAFPAVIHVDITDDALCVQLTDGGQVTVPISWYPRLAHAEARDRASFKLVGGGHGIHWPELDEDISVESLLLGQPSGEGAKSFTR